jgi:hypothetical protein
VLDPPQPPPPEGHTGLLKRLPSPLKRRMTEQLCSQTLAYLRDFPWRRIRVHSQRSTLAFDAPAAELPCLVQQSLVEPVFNKHGYLRRLILKVSVQYAHRAIRDASRPPLPTKLISKRKTGRGALRWPARLDKAKRGCGGPPRHWSGLAALNGRLYGP